MPDKQSRLFGVATLWQYHWFLHLYPIAKLRHWLHPKCRNGLLWWYYIAKYNTDRKTIIHGHTHPYRNPNFQMTMSAFWEDIIASFHTNAGTQRAPSGAISHDTQHHCRQQGQRLLEQHPSIIRLKSTLKPIAGSLLNRRHPIHESPSGISAWDLAMSASKEIHKGLVLVGYYLPVNRKAKIENCKSQFNVGFLSSFKMSMNASIIILVAVTSAV